MKQKITWLFMEWIGPIGIILIFINAIIQLFKLFF